MFTAIWELNGPVPFRGIPPPCERDGRLRDNCIGGCTALNGPSLRYRPHTSEGFQMASPAFEISPA